MPRRSNSFESLCRPAPGPDVLQLQGRYPNRDNIVPAPQLRQVRLVPGVGLDPITSRALQPCRIGRARGLALGNPRECVSEAPARNRPTQAVTSHRLSREIASASKVIRLSKKHDTYDILRSEASPTPMTGSDPT